MRRENGAQLAGEREDRLQRALQENHQLKHEVRELQDKLKVLQVKFRRLTNDLKRVSPEMLRHLGDVVPAVGSTAPHCAGSEGPQRAQKGTASSRAAAQPTTERPPLGISAAANAASQAQTSPAVSLVLDQLRQDLARSMAERERVNAESDTLREELTRVRAELDSVRLLQQQQRVFEQHSHDILHERAETAEGARQQSEAEYHKVIDALIREKDTLAMKLRLLQDENTEKSKELASVDPTVLIQLQNAVHDRSKQITVLTSRMQGAQQQAETLKGECFRLVEELKRFQFMQSETKKQLFEAEHEKSLLQVRCARLEELEGALQRKSEELIRMEQELLQTVGTLHSCNRETEEAVRRELSSRIADLQEMRDNAEARRREKESQLLNAQHQIADLKRQLEVSRQDTAMYREQVQKAEVERTEMATRAAVAGHVVEEFGDDGVRRALAVAAIRKTANRHSSEAEEALDMWDALRWDNNWEANQLREALSTAALDMELANTRCTQMTAQIEQNRLLLQQVSQERDTLLEENMEMRRQLSHVQTVFAKQQLEAYRGAKTREAEGGSAQTGVISFSIRDVETDEGLLRALGIGEAVGAAVALFFTMDGLQSYDTMLSPTFYALDEPLDIRFCYDHLDRDEVTVADIRNTTFVFQLHQVWGTTNTIVAMAEIPGVALLACRELTVLERVQMVSGNGEPAGAIMVEMSASNLMLPVLLDRPLSSALFTADAMRATLLALRSVVALRVQVFRADGLLGTPVPQPYVFYTSSTPSGMSCVRDTVVRTSTRAFTVDPVFDADPVDHQVVVDRELVEFMATGAIVFVVFDERAKEVQANLGVAKVPLQPLLKSSQAVLRSTETLHPQGTLNVGVSWVCRT